MAILEVDRLFTLSSTGTTARIDGLTVQNWKCFVDTPAGSSASFQINSFRDINSTTPAIPYGTAQNLNASSGVCLEWTGPMPAVALRVSDLQGTINVRFVGN